MHIKTDEKEILNSAIWDKIRRLDKGQKIFFEIERTEESNFEYNLLYYKKYKSDEGFKDKEYEEPISG